MALPKFTSFSGFKPYLTSTILFMDIPEPSTQQLPMTKHRLDDAEDWFFRAFLFCEGLIFFRGLQLLLHLRYQIGICWN